MADLFMDLGKITQKNLLAQLSLWQLWERKGTEGKKGQDGKGKERKISEKHHLNMKSFDKMLMLGVDQLQHTVHATQNLSSLLVLLKLH